MRKKLAILSLIMAILLSLYGILSVVTLHNNASFSPDYSRVDLDEILNKTDFSEDDYKTLFYQTGLGKYAIDSIKGTADFKERVKEYQQLFFKQTDYTCSREAITTNMEYFVDAEGEYIHGFKMFDVKDGYVLIMESSHSFGWRHGHAGIVVSNGNAVLEAPIIGQPTQKYMISTWTKYPTFIMLRLKDTSDAKLKEIALDAEKYLDDSVYNPLAGVFKKDQGQSPDSVQCAYLVWYAFFNHGIDIDSDGGNIVTVKDIKDSDLFEVVQIYGYNPADFW